MRMHRSRLRLGAIVASLALFAAACGGTDTATEEPAAEEPAAEEPAAEEPAAGPFTLGVSNTLVGNGWREQMICAIKAEALASGVVDQVIVINEDGGPTEQIGHIESLISQGVDAIVLNPTDREALNPAIEAAIAQGIVVVAVDQAVTAPGAIVATNDQVAYGRVGAEWLFEQMGGVGKVLYMRGIDGNPADSDRDAGFQEALANYPDIEVVSEVFTNWDPTTGAQQALDTLNAQDIDGIWTSGIDYTVVEQFAVAGKDYVPVVGADNNGFIAQMIDLYDDGFVGGAVTNPPAIGGVGAAIAIKTLLGESFDALNLLTPEVYDMVDRADETQAIYQPDQQVGWSTYVEIAPYTTYTADQVVACKGPGE
ncbi:MAG: hypothetical protein RLZZ272_1032 [Actinomycetota bacterium]